MMERLKFALALPLSRKVLVALAAGALAVANKKLDIGLSEDTIHFLIGTACFVILGIAIEDHAEKSAPPTVTYEEMSERAAKIADTIRKNMVDAKERS